MQNAAAAHNVGRTRPLNDRLLIKLFVSLAFSSAFHMKNVFSCLRDKKKSRTACHAWVLRHIYYIFQFSKDLFRSLGFNLNSLLHASSHAEFFFLHRGSCQTQQRLLIPLRFTWVCFFFLFVFSSLMRVWHTFKYKFN